MGGDHAPEEIVRGALDWAALHPDVHILLVGDEARIKPFLGPRPLPANVTLVQAGESVSMEEHPAQAVRRKRDASINVCMRLVKSGRADAVVTAGHTGAGVASAILFLGRLRGVDRPALAVQLVTDKGPMVLLDIGATTDSNGHNLAQYARMGAIFSEQVMGVSDPSVALLSIGEEGGKGEARVQEATELLAPRTCVSSAMPKARTCPSTRPTSSCATHRWATSSSSSSRACRASSSTSCAASSGAPPWGPIGYLFMRPGMARIRRRFDYERLGGAPLLGVNGTVLITHGRARRRMIGFAVEVGAAAAKANIPGRIRDAMAAEAGAGDRRRPAADEQSAAVADGQA